MQAEQASTGNQQGQQPEQQAPAGKQQKQSERKQDIAMGIRIQSQSLLQKHEEPDGWDAVHLRATLEPLPEFDTKTFVWRVLKDHGCVYWKAHDHHRHMAGSVDHADVKKDGRADLHLYLDLQQKSARELYRALVRQQPLQFRMPGKALVGEDGKIAKAVSGRLVLEPADGSGQPVQYNTPLGVGAKLQELAEQEDAEEQQEGMAEELARKQPRPGEGADDDEGDAGDGDSPDGDDAEAAE